MNCFPRKALSSEWRKSKRNREFVALENAIFSASRLNGNRAFFY